MMSDDRRPGGEPMSQGSMVRYLLNTMTDCMKWGLIYRCGGQGSLEFPLKHVMTFFYGWRIYAAHKETSALLRSTQNIVPRKHHVPVQGVPSTAIIVPNYFGYEAKTSLDY